MCRYHLVSEREGWSWWTRCAPSTTRPGRPPPRVRARSPATTATVGTSDPVLRAAVTIPASAASPSARTRAVVSLHRAVAARLAPLVDEHQLAAYLLRGREQARGVAVGRQLEEMVRVAAEQPFRPAGQRRADGLDLADADQSVRRLPLVGPARGATPSSSGGTAHAPRSSSSLKRG